MNDRGAHREDPTDGARAEEARAEVARFPAARMDRPTKTVTFATVLLFVVLLPPALLAGTDGADPLVGLVLGLAIGSFVLAAWGLSPAAFSVSDGVLRVHRRIFRTREFRLDGPVRKAPPAVGLGVRLGLTGGMFGWSGRMWNRQAGSYRAYLTDRSRIVACDTADGLVVISPQDPTAFVRAAKRHRGRKKRKGAKA